MNYQNVNDLTIKQYRDIKTDNPTVSIPKDGTELIMGIWYVITYTAVPAYDAKIEKAIEVAPVNYIQTWEIIPLTQDELDVNDLTINESMRTEGKDLTHNNLLTLDVGLPAIIEDKPAHDVWMQGVYGDVTPLKPPETQRQLLNIVLEDRDNYTFTRYNDQWGWRWYLELFRPDVNALAIAIYDAGGNYLYTTGGLIDTGNGSWYTECPAGQATATQQDVYYKWLLGSSNISDLEVYEAITQTKSGTVHSDPRYD